MNYTTCAEIELKLVKWFNPRTNLIVPNVSWGFLKYECDLLIISKLGYLIEVEIKVSLSDLKRDLLKRHNHDDNRIKYLYFAIPKKLEKHIEHIPERAGIFVVDEEGWVHKIRKPTINNIAKPISIEDMYKIARLGTLRVWNLKKKILKSKLLLSKGRGGIGEIG